MEKTQTSSKRRAKLNEIGVGKEFGNKIFKDFVEK